MDANNWNLVDQYEFNTIFVTISYTYMLFLQKVDKLSLNLQCFTSLAEKLGGPDNKLLLRKVQFILRCGWN